MQDVSIITFIQGVLNLLEKDCLNLLFMYYTGPLESLYICTINIVHIFILSIISHLEIYSIA